MDENMNGETKQTEDLGPLSADEIEIIRQHREYVDGLAIDDPHGQAICGLATLLHDSDDFMLIISRCNRRGNGREYSIGIERAGAYMTPTYGATFAAAFLPALSASKPAADQPPQPAA
jgi:hypothetical protein